MSLRDIDIAVQLFINGAKTAEKAGFAGIELHGAHGYLISKILAQIIPYRRPKRH